MISFWSAFDFYMKIDIVLWDYAVSCHGFYEITPVL